MINFSLITLIELPDYVEQPFALETKLSHNLCLGDIFVILCQL
jgi:hypothetical protein